MKNLFALSLLGLAFTATPSMALYQLCPEGSSRTLVKLVAAPYDCRSQVIVIYQGESQDSNFQRQLGCLTEDSAGQIFRNHPEVPLYSEVDYPTGQQTLVCLTELDGQVTGSSQPLVSISAVLQNNATASGTVYERGF